MKIKVAIVVKESIEKVWECWTQVEHIMEWYNPSDTWYVSSAESNFKKGGKFKTKMEEMDNSGAFTFEGAFTEIQKYEKICFTISDGRKAEVTFKVTDDGILIMEEFDATTVQHLSVQETGWQSFLHSFKEYVEA